MIIFFENKKHTITDLLTSCHVHLEIIKSDICNKIQKFA